MEGPTSAPYITAALEASQAELDMSGATPFRLTIIAMLHAQGPVVCYVADSFLSPKTALRKGGIDFTKLGSAPQSVQRSTVSINTGNSTTRPWNVADCLFLQPGKPVSIEIPFGSQDRREAYPTDFDVRLWVTTSGFETGSSYEATLPGTGTISWWRWASQDKVPEYGQGEPVESLAMWPPGELLSLGKDNNDTGVPVLPKEQQLPIYASQDKVVFTCLGQSIKPLRQTR